jgi:hypothetical protein
LRTKISLVLVITNSHSNPTPYRVFSQRHTGKMCPLPSLIAM